MEVFLSHNHEPRNNRIPTKPIKQTRCNEIEKELPGSMRQIHCAAIEETSLMRSLWRDLKFTLLPNMPDVFHGRNH